MDRLQENQTEQTNLNEPTQTNANQVVKWKTSQPQNASHIDLSNSSYDWVGEGMGQICAQMEVWNVQALWIGDKNQPKILKHLENVWLNQLIRIDVSGNCIESIESMCRMTLPCLKELYIQQNKIFNLTPLSRCLLPALYFIGISGNFIQDASCLARMQLSELSWLGFEYQDCDLFSNDVHWVVKINTSKINMLQMVNTHRIKEDRLDKTFLARFKSLASVSRN